ncbi:MAG TPA: cobalamin B12-binding domain-containing protein, partial [Isosphaeraceae bacterium]
MTVLDPDLEYYRRLLSFDWPGAIAVVDRYLAERVGDVEGLYAEVLAPALVHTGREWEQGRISVAHEHYISEVTRDVIRRHGRRLWEHAPGSGPVAVACCVPGERHTIGLMMVCDVLAAGGLIVHMLGESAPREAIRDFVVQCGAELLCLSCTLDVFLPDAVDLIGRVRAAGPGLGVVIGGAAFGARGESLARLVGADYFAADIRALRHRLPGWLAGRTGAPRPIPAP